MEEEESRGEKEMAMEKAKHIVSSTPVIIFSKTYCAYCHKVKALFKQLGAAAQVVELDQENNGDAMQEALHEWTGQRTVPNVFIGGNHVRGCDSIIELHRQGKLVPMLLDARAITYISDQVA
ncbi:Glutaredoxin-C2-like protein [Drosera capensis]